MTKTTKTPAATPVPPIESTATDPAPIGDEPKLDVVFDTHPKLPSNGAILERISTALEVVHGVSHLDSAQALPEVGADVECVPFEGTESQIHAFKGTDGRTMQVVVTDDGLAARELAD